jgi:hypothetical protein
VLGGVDWAGATCDIARRGWVRLVEAVDPATCALLREAAPPDWESEPERIGTVRQRGLRAGGYFATAAPVVRELGETLISGLGGDALAPPDFNLVTWNRTDGGEGYITQHRDPPTAGGVIAVVNLQGRARFHVWDDDGEHGWQTRDGDIVLLRGTGWPEAASTCPLHEARALDPDRWTMTLRHNTRGPDVDYFA